MNLNDWEREREFILFITEYMDRFSVLMAKHHIFEPQFPSYVYLYYIPPQSGGYNDLSYRQGPLASEFPTELRSLLIYCKYPVYWFHKNCVHLLRQTDRVFVQWSVPVK